MWGIGVAAVISGDFSGWNYGISSAGWGGFVIAVVLVTVMYVAMLCSIGEMSAAMPHTGGAYSFARAAMGPWGGFVTGMAETIEYVATTAVVVYFSASYADGITSELFGVSLPPWLWWVLLYGVFLALNIVGAEVSFRFALVVSVLSLLVLAVFAVLALTSDALEGAKLFDIAPDPGASTFLPHGLGPVVLAMPFAMWLFLGIEELPLAAEEAHTPTRDIPRAGLWGLATLVVTGAVVVVLNPAVTGAAALGESDEPLLDGFRAILPGGDLAAVLSAFALIGLLASLQGIMYAYGRNVYSLSRARYYPKALSLTGSRKTPWAALLAGAVVGFLALLVVQFSGSEAAGSIVLNIAVWGAVVAYVLQMVSFVLLRRRFPRATRPYRSPVGVPGAVLAGALALVVFVGFLFNATYRPAIVAIAVVFAIGLLGFALHGRHRLVLSPEEEYAMTGGLAGEAADDAAR
nr:amino acid permease [Kineococcus siccus]